MTEYINKFKHIVNKNFNFLLCFKGIRCNKLEIDFNIGGRGLGHLDLVTHPDVNPVQQSLTLVNRREPVFSKGNSHQVFVIYQMMNNFSSKFFEESFFGVPNYIIISLQGTSPRTMKTTISSPLSRSSTSASGIPVYRPGSSCFSSTPC